MPDLTREEARAQALGGLFLLSSLEAQWDYELNAPIANVPAELFEIGGEILALMISTPDAFNDEEMDAIDRVGWLIGTYARDLPDNLIEMQVDTRWQEVMAASKAALKVIGPDWTPPPIPDPTPPNPVGTWSEYFTSMEAMPLHPMYAELDKYLPEEGDAIELACGLGKGAVHLAEKGLTVWATDIQGRALYRMVENASPDLRTRLHAYVSSFEQLDLAPAQFDVVVAAFCLFFMPKEVFAEKWPIIADSVRPHGLFMGQFLGPRDDWAEIGYTSQSRPQVEELLKDFDLLHFEEVERRGKTSQGAEKQWHIFHVIAKRQPTA